MTERRPSPASPPEVVVRGGDLDADIIRADAQRMHSVYGIYGISVFAPRGLTLDGLAQPLVRFSGLTILTVADIRAAGLRLEATGRNPRHFTIILANLDGAGALSACPRRRWPNPYHDP